jgi:hypothetical protein
VRAGDLEHSAADARHAVELAPMDKVLAANALHVRTLVDCV